MLIVLPLLVVPYHETLKTTGIITKDRENYVIAVNVPRRYISNIWNSKIIFQKKKYRVDVKKFFYDDTKGEYGVVLKINIPKKIQVENVPIDITFQLKETTLLKQIEQKMKGWFS